MVQHQRRRSFFGAAILLIVAAPALLAAQERTGWFHVVYVDPPRGQRPPAPTYNLVDAQGRGTRLVVDEATLRAAGGPLALSRRRMTVSGAAVSGVAPAPGVSAAPAVRVSSVRALEPVGAAAPDFSGPVSLGVRPYVMLLCKFSDVAEEPHPKSWYDALLGPTRPNMKHFYDEMSYGRFSLAGSVAAGWFTLPKRYVDYYPGGSSTPDFGLLLRDCAGAADASVDFTQYAGIIVQHNLGPDWAFGGSWTLTVDGQTRSFGVAWMPKSGPAQLAHEIGHTIGLAHSSGGYTEVYDSRWDLMSYPYVTYDPTLSPPDWVQQHTLMGNKHRLGWIDGVNQLMPALPSRQSVLLLRGAQTPSTAGFHYARIPDPAAVGTYYWVEARRKVSYDQGVPGDAVVIHTYDPSRSEPARVVDGSRNGDPNDAGAMWTPGESFTDSILGLTVDVDSMNAVGFGVTVVRGWRLRMQATGPGSITGAPTGACSATCEHVAATRGAAVTLSALPNAGAQFLGWTGACGGTSACAVTLAGNRVVGAKFAMPVTFASATDRPRAIVGRPYQDKLVASGGSEAISWSVASGALPPGISLAAGTGVLSGQPTSEGRFQFTVTATSGTLTTAKSFVIVAVRPLAIVTDAALPRAVAGTAYARTLAADGGVGTVSWSVASGALPGGVALESTTGTLAGTPTAAGAYTFTVLATSDTLRDTRKFTLSVAAPVSITTTAGLKAATVAAAYADTIRATGGTDAFDWRIVAGALPAGLAFEPNGVLRGTPTASGTFRFTASATSDGLTAEREFELTVAKPSLAAAAVLDLLLAGSSTLTAEQRAYLDLIGNRNGRVDVGDVRAWLVDIGTLPARAPPAESMAALSRLRRQQSLGRSPGSSSAAPAGRAAPR